MLLSLLERHAPSYANPGNRNNEIGLPLSVLDAPDQARFAIYEMGAGKPDDIAYLSPIARPDIALVNNVGPAHLARMGKIGQATVRERVCQYVYIPLVAAPYTPQ